ncbi:hypothetical protein [Streptomyces sp. NPDC094049]|uniref:hypothetical protein n=1 Tax=Streptomyces sp. NPDC094049 TaxID=3154987 RepID=UPI00331C669D
MSISAHLLDSLRLPEGRALVQGSVWESRSGRPPRALLLHGDDLEVHELDALFGGEQAPAAVFPLPWPDFARGGGSVSPDGSFAVFAGQRAVRAVTADGGTLWEYEHTCWGSPLGHSHPAAGRGPCQGYEHGSCRVSDDGRFVWAHVLAPGEEYQEVWSVLDARDGRELARIPLGDSEASGSQHFSHPDGVHMGLCVGMGQDGVLLFWARWDGTRPVVWDLDGALDRILVDVHPAHGGFLTVEHYGSDLRLHALDGTVLAARDPLPAAEGADADELPWDHAPGFVDADTVVVSTGVEYDVDDSGPRHWLLDARTLEIRGPVTYPGGPVDSPVRPLGDGSWLTYDAEADGGTLSRWTAEGDRTGG